MAAAGTVITSSKFEALAARLVESGRYTSPSEVLEAAVEALEREECDDDLDVEYVRRAIAEGEESGTYKGDVFADLRAKYHLPPRS